MPIWKRLLAHWDPVSLQHFTGTGGARSAEVQRRLDAAFRETEQTGLMFASLVRVAIVGVLVVAFALTGPLVGNGLAFLLLAPLGLLAIGAVQFEVARRWRNSTWPKYALIAADCLYLAAILAVRHRFAGDLPTAALSVKEGALLFFTAFLIHGAFSYSPRFILWIGLCVSIAWGGVLTAAALEPGTFFRLTVRPGESSLTTWQHYGDISYLPIPKIIYDYIVVVLLTGGLAAAVWRSRRLVMAAALTERARTNLSRHFSPNVVEMLSRRDKPFAEVCWQRAAVLFADVRGFTTRCESMEPIDAITFLREFHSRMEACIFNNGGTLDKVMGDGLLAVFGMPEEGEDDAVRALRCAFDMLRTVEEWNEERRRVGAFDVRIGVGLHYGNVMLGDVGSERLMTFTVVGDTVNVASRLQTLSKDLHAELVASEKLVEAIRQCRTDATALLARLHHVGAHRLRGRERDIGIFAPTRSNPEVEIEGITASLE
jgi:adenylate cyclase